MFDLINSISIGGIAATMSFFGALITLLKIGGSEINKYIGTGFLAVGFAMQYIDSMTKTADKIVVMKSFIATSSLVATLVFIYLLGLSVHCILHYANNKIQANKMSSTDRDSESASQ